MIAWDLSPSETETAVGMEKPEQQGWILKTKVLWERVVATVTASAPLANWDRQTLGV